MTAIIVDSDVGALEDFEKKAGKISGVEIVGKFRSPKAALSYVGNNTVDLAVLDTELPEMDGISLGKELRNICPDIVLIYVTEHEEHAFNAFQLDACAYIPKPAGEKELEKAMTKAEKLIGRKSVSVGEHKVFIQTFGRFEVFVDGIPVAFNSNKAKELLALLVDRKGGIVNTEEILTYLWEDKPDTDSSRSLCRKTIQRLHNNLQRYGVDYIIIRHSRGRSLDKSKVTCDYYDYLAGKESVYRSFFGEYMINYSWAEETLSRLLKYEGK